MVFAGLSGMLGNIVYGELEPILALRMHDYDATIIQTGMCLSIYGFVYMIGAILTPMIPDRVERRFTLMMGMFGIGFFLFFVGPS